MNSLLVAQASAPARTGWTLRANPAATLRAAGAHACGWAWRTQRTALVLGAELSLAAGSYILAVFAFAETRGEGWPGRVLWATLGVMMVLRLGGLVSVGL